VNKKTKQSFVYRYLDPTERLGDLLSALITVLTITLGVSLATSQKGSTSQVAWAIIGCNLAWGLLDGWMYVVTQLYDRGRKVQLIQSLRSARTVEEQLTTIGSALDDRLSPLTSPAERRTLYLEISRRLAGVDAPRTRIVTDDIYGALETVWLTVVASVPAVVPFLILADRFVAARVSNALVLLSLFAVGYGFARTINANRWTVGLSTAVFGLVMVTIAIMLGG
jgi:hypothetical protein